MTIYFKSSNLQESRSPVSTGKKPTILDVTRASGGMNMENDASRKMLRYRWFVFSVLALAYLFVYFHRLSLSVVANELISDFQTTAGMIGVMGSIYFYCYAAMQLPAGILSDSIGPRKTITFFLLIAAFGSILFGMSPDIKTAIAGRVMVGFGVATVFIPSMKIFSQWFRKHEFAQMAGILNGIGGVGVLGATWFLAIMASNLGWRFSFVIIGACTFIITILVWFIVRDHPRDQNWPSIAEMENRLPDVQSETIKIPIGTGIKTVFGEIRFWPLAMWFFFDCGIFFGFGALWSGPYLMDVYGLTRSETGSILSMIAWGMIVGSPLLGLLSDRILKSRKKPMVICTSLLTLLMLVFHLFPGSLPKLALYIFFFLFSVSASAIVAIGFTSTKELFPVSIAGTSVGTVNLFPFLGGAVFMPILGKILDNYPKTTSGGYPVEGYETLTLTLLISSILALVCTLFLKETFEK
jgi:sugar phosphate permease